MTESNFKKGKELIDEKDRLNMFLADYIQQYNYHGKDTVVVAIESTVTNFKTLNHKILGDKISKEIYEYTRDKIAERIAEIQKEFNEL